jgi:hypothetical protein
MPKTTLSLAPTTIAKTIARAEWDFSACLRARVNFCRSYEFARQMEREYPGFLDQMKAAHREKFDTKENQHYQLQGPDDDQRRCFFEIIDAPPGFPTEPYLSLGHKPTLQSYHPFRLGYPFAVRYCPIREVWFDGHDFHRGQLQEEMNLNPHDFYSFDIDWSQANKELTKAFQKWLVARRPTPSLERRGLPLVEIYRADLRALGAYRLIRHFESAAEANRYTTKLDPQNRGLYFNLNQWYRAETRAQKILLSWKKGLSL